MSSWPFAPGESPFRMKGIAYRAFLKFIEEELPGGKEAFLQQLEDPALREFASQAFLAASWYDVGPVVAMNEVVAGIRGEPMEAFLRQRGRAHAEEDLSGVYAWLLRLATPAAVAKGLPRLVQRYFDWGETLAEDVGPGHVRVVRSGIPDHLAQWLDSVSLPYIEYALEKTGARGLELSLDGHPAERVHGQPASRRIYDIRWRA
ncbi:MAG: hypothetical protein VYE22_22975 [Myxococcota bacterium]|nr:hypothetical protein [Myxococcota bacterium]